MKKVLKILVLVFTVAALATLWWVSYQHHFRHSLVDVKLLNNNGTKDGFIDYDRELHTVWDICDTLTNKTIRDVPLDSVHSYLIGNPWITDVKVEITLDNILVVHVEEGKPLMRIYNENGESVYADTLGRLFPIENEYVPHVLVGNGNLKFPVVRTSSGNIDDPVYSHTKLLMMYDVMKKILKDPYTSCCVKQVYFENEGDIELVLNSTDVNVVLGDINDMEIKLSNMQRFFDEMLGSEELKQFKKVNFNFVNQVVCTKY